LIVNTGTVFSWLGREGEGAGQAENGSNTTFFFFSKEGTVLSWLSKEREGAEGPGEKEGEDAGTGSGAGAGAEVGAGAGQADNGCSVAFF